ncbi:MAG: hypothetical protein M3Y76_01735, partial [Chloroflexota bacterium]|nr:hypothetical protein [Chloroflexota bacterium]
STSPPPRRGKLVPILTVGSAVLVSAIIVLVVASLSLGSFSPSTFDRNTSSPHVPLIPPSQIVGHVLFSSSGQINENTSQGIADQIELDLSTIHAPAVGKSYYAWLLNDDPVEGKVLLLGQLPVIHGQVHFHFNGDQQHTNLLEVTNRLLVTEEDAGTIPSTPSLDTSTWRFMAEFPQKPNPQDTVHHFSLLSHLRHLLASDPTLKSFGMPGGLDIWLFRNVQKVLEWSGSARDDWANQSTDLMHRHIIRILDYLDGLSYVQQDVPVDAPVLVNERIARVSLLEFDVQHQEPPGFLYHIALHLQGMVDSPGATTEQKHLAIQIDAAINKVEALLEQVHQDAKKLVVMTNTQLQQPSTLSLLDDMVKHAQDAFIGQFDPATGEIQNGVTQIHYAIQRLATIEVAIVPATSARAANSSLELCSPCLLNTIHLQT